MTRIIRTETRRRGPVGKLLKAIFIVFNILMLIWLVWYWFEVSSMAKAPRYADAQGTAALGMAIGTTSILIMWLTGAVVLGMFVAFTRGKRVVIEDRSDI